YSPNHCALRRMANGGRVHPPYIEGLRRYSCTSPLEQIDGVRRFIEMHEGRHTRYCPPGSAALHRPLLLRRLERRLPFLRLAANRPLVLVTGSPRSGTTWVGDVLRHCPR